MSRLKLKPLEDSNLYKRRTTSKENLLHGSQMPSTAEHQFIGSTNTYVNFNSLEHASQANHMGRMGERLYQNTPDPIRNVHNVNGVGGITNSSTASVNHHLYRYSGDNNRDLSAQPFREVPSSSGSYIVRDLKSLNLNNIQQQPQQQPVAETGVRYPTASNVATTPPRKMESKDQAGRSNVEVIGFVN